MQVAHGLKWSVSGSNVAAAGTPPSGGADLSAEGNHVGGGPQSLAEGCVVGGNVLRSLLAFDDVSSLWLTDPPKNGAAACCIRAISETVFITPNARHRFRPELEFWKNRALPDVVRLHQCGWDSGYYFMLMQHMPEGSLAHRHEPELWRGAKLIDLALALANVLRGLHGEIGPHGNLKPPNVFPLADGRVCVSDFLLPLWLDELEAGPALASHLIHPYRAPEQRADPRDYDTRSDVYSFGLILLQCLNGAVPSLDESDPNEVTADWPLEMLPVVHCCLETDPERRYADGPELYDALSRATERGAPAARPVAEVRSEDERLETAWLEWDADETSRRVRQAAQLAQDGRLETALEVIESLPPNTPGVAEVLDEIERRDEQSGDLASEAIRLAGTGNMDAALDALGEAEELYGKSEAVKSAKTDLTGLQTPPPAAPDGVEQALQDERYAVARAALEKQLRDGEQTPQLAEQVRRFRKGRARKGFLENIRNARLFYLRGEFTESAQRWLEAARWLAPSPERDRLRRIAQAAARGVLRIDVEALAATAQQNAQTEAATTNIPQLTPEVQAKLDAAARLAAEHERRRLLILLGILAVLLGGGIAVLMAIWL